jgi:uncharacterized membrane protein YbhN (UPF0104 family)
MHTVPMRPREIAWSLGSNWTRGGAWHKPGLARRASIMHEWPKDLATPSQEAVKQKAVVTIALTLLVVAGGIGLASTLHRIDWTVFADVLGQVSALPLAIAFFISTVQVFGQLARFVAILPRAGRPPLRQLLEVTAVGQLLNYTTPLRAGDAYKLARLSSNGGLVALTSGLVLERVADVMALLLVTLPTVASLHLAGKVSAMPVREIVPRIAIAVVVVTFAGEVLIRRRPGVLARFAHESLETLRSHRFARCLAVAVAAWILDASTLYWTARSAGSAIAFTTALPCVFLLNVGIAIPVTVGNLGIFEASLAFGLTQYGIGAERALAIATVEHVAKLVGLVVCTALLKLAPRPRDS